MVSRKKRFLGLGALAAFVSIAVFAGHSSTRNVPGDQITRSSGAVLSLPTATDTLAGIAASQTFTNKTYTLGTASRLLVTDPSGDIAASSATSVEAGYLSGVDSSLCGIDQTCTETNKTFTSPTITTPSITTPTITGDVAITGGASLTDAITISEIATPSTPAAGTQKIYPKSDGKVYHLDDAGIEQELGSGSGSGISFITGDDFDFEGADVNWAAFDDATGSTPVGAGGDFTGNAGGLTFSCARETANASDYAHGTGYLLLTHTAADEQGQGCSLLVDVEGYAGQRLTFTALMSVLSGTYAADDIGVYAYDVTNAEVISPISVMTGTGYKGNTATIQAAFDTKSTTTTLRIAFYVHTSTATAYTVAVDDALLGPNAPPSATPVSDWTAFTMSVGGSTSAPTKASSPVRDEARYRQVGDSVEVQYNYAHTSATGAAAGSGIYLFALPNSLQIDSSKLAVTTETGQGALGRCALNVASNVYHGTVQVYSATQVYCSFVRSGDASGTSTELSSTNTAWNNATFKVSFGYTVPVSGWSASGNLATSERYRIADIAQTRVTGAAPDALGEYRSYLRDANALTYTETNGSPSTAPSSANGFWMPASPSGYDTADAASTPTKYEIFVGKNKHVQYQFYGSTGRTGEADTSPTRDATNARGIAKSYDPTTGIVTLWGHMVTTATDNSYPGISSTSAALNPVYFDIIVSDNPIPVESESAVKMVAYKNGGAITAATTIASWTGELQDTESAFNATTGEFTVPRSGDYYVSFEGVTTGTTNNLFKFFVNGVEKLRHDGYAANGQRNVSGLLVNLVRGDVVVIKPTNNDTLASTDFNRLSIFEVR